MELEEEDAARLESLEPDGAARLPEVDLVDAGPTREELVPVEVGDADEEAHCLARLAEDLVPLAEQLKVGSQ